MRRRSFLENFRFSDIGWRFSRLRRRWSFHWQGVGRTPWIAGGVAIVVLGVFGYFIHTVVTYKKNHQQVRCLALNIYFEARGEPEEGQYAVAEVTMNRVAAAFYPDTVCDVVYQKNWDRIRKRYVSAFSWTEFDTMPAPTGEEWIRAWTIAEEVYHRRRPQELKDALHFHAVYIKPSWAVGRKPLARIGRHVFYK
jgi:N-acetylmuramoyl-L-alanine amidase